MAETQRLELAQPAPAIVQNWIKAASPPQRNEYLARGEPQCIELQTIDMASGDFATKLLPGIRGVIVGQPVETAEAAIAKAAEMLARFRESEREAVDEAAAGIDGEAYELMLEAERIGLRVEKIIHVGTMGLEDAGDDVDDFLTDMVQLGDCHPALHDEFPVIARLIAMEKEEPMTGAQWLSSFAEMCRDAGTVGFLVQVSVPEHRPHKGGGASVHMGTRRLSWHYGSTYPVAFARGADWATAEIDRMMTGAAA